MPNPNKRSAFAGVLLLALGMMMSGAAGAATKKKTQQGPPPKPIPTDQSLGFYGNTREEMRGSIKRIGVLPVRLPAMLEEREDGAKLVQDTMIRYLTQAGFEVVGPESYQAAYDRFNKQLGGMYDAKTGLLKRDAAAAVLNNARREFVTKNRLDGFVIVRVLPSVANYFSKYARWDGVQDRCDGELPDPVTRFLEVNSSEGTVPALSIRVQIVNTQDRVTFARDGGIELTSYFTDLTFRRVPLDSLLKDPARIERAVRVVTVPLLHTPVEIRDGDDDPMINAMKVKLRDLPPQPKAASEARKSPLLVPRDQILSSVKRVALSPVTAYDFQVPPDVLEALRGPGARRARAAGLGDRGFAEGARSAPDQDDGEPGLRSAHRQTRRGSRHRDPQMGVQEPRHGHATGCHRLGDHRENQRAAEKRRRGLGWRGPERVHARARGPQVLERLGGSGRRHRWHRGVVAQCLHQ